MTLTPEQIEAGENPVDAYWPSRGMAVVGSVAYAIASHGIKSGAHDAPYNDMPEDADGEPPADDLAFWNRVAKNSKRIARWACQSLGISDRAISASLPTGQSGEAIEVVELVWDRHLRADVYRVSESFGQGPKPFFAVRGSRVIGWFDDIEAAKAAAQADYRTRILSAIVTHPAQPVADEGLVERLRRRVEQMRSEQVAEDDTRSFSKGKIAAYGYVLQLLDQDAPSSLGGA